MTGSIRRRGRTWTYTVDLPRGEDGRRRQRLRSGFPTKKEAEEALRAFLGHLDAGGDPFPDKMTFRQYAVSWLEHHRSQVEPKTWARYEQLVRVHLLPALGSTQLGRIRPAHVQAALDAIDRAPRTVQQARAVLSRMMRQAQAWGLIMASPVSATRSPKAERPDLDIPDATAAQALMAAAVGGPFEMPMYLAAYTGARRGEVLAVAWSEVDLDRGRIRITRSLEHTGQEWRFKEPKTPRSRREVAIPPNVVERLRQHRLSQAERQLAAGPAWQNLGLVCDRGDGGPVLPDSFTQGFKRLAARVGVPGARLHDLRHAAATTMMEAGVHPAVVSKSLGHASEAFTMAVYGHVRDEWLDSAGDALEAAYGRV